MDMVARKELSAVILVTSNGMGQADPELGHMLVKKYFSILLINEMLPTAICFYAEGVKLVVEGSPILDELIALQDRGVYLIICLTCLNYYDLKDKRQLGVVGGMGDIVDVQWRADKVITI